LLKLADWLNEKQGGFFGWRKFIVAFFDRFILAPLQTVFCAELWSALATPTPPRLLRRPWFGRGRRFL
jgi:hypothetical protein